MKHYMVGALPARLGDEMSGQTLLLLAIGTTGSTAVSSSLLAALTFSAAVGGPLLGAILDRAVYPGIVMGLVLGLYALGMASIALLLGHVPVWSVVIVALAAGFCMPSISGGWSSRLKSFTTNEWMTRASAIDATTFNIAGLAGPALAGLITLWLGVHWAVVALIALLMAAIPMALLLPKRSIMDKSVSSSLARDIVAGFRVIASNGALRRVTLTSVVSYMGIGMLWVLYPLIGIELMSDAAYGGVLASVLSVAALVATMAYARWPTRHSSDMVVLVTTFVLALAMLLLALANSIVMSVIAVMIAGLADGPQLAAVFAVRHREAPERSRSQVFTTGASLKITAAAIGAALVGHLSSFSVPGTILVACGVQLLAAVVFLLSSRQIKHA